MKIDEAIQDLMRFSEYCERVNWLTHGKAAKLGVEALKAVKKWREQHRDLGFLLLPGETEE